MNSDMVNLVANAEGDPVYAQLDFLLHEPSSPLYIENGLPSVWIFGTPLRNDFFGKWEWDHTLDGFIRTDTSQALTINIPGFISLDSGTVFQCPQFNCLPYKGMDCLPPALAAFLISFSDTVLTFSGNVAFRDELPETIAFDLSAKDLKCSIHSNRTRSGDSGHIETTIKLTAKGHTVLTGTIFSKIGYSGNNFFYKTITSDLQIFQVNITGTLDYSNINPTSEDYISSFNEHCRIKLTDTSSGIEIGRLGLETRQDNGLMGWVIFLSDGNPVFLEDYLALVFKVINFKIPRRNADAGSKSDPLADDTR